MPGPGIHYYISTQLKNKFDGNRDPMVAGAIRALENFPEYAAFGAMGPDFLFFNFKDMGIPKELVELYQIVSSTIFSIREQMMELVPDELIQLKDDLESAASDLVQYNQTLTQLNDALNDANLVIQTLLATLTQVIVKHVTDAVDVFSLLSHPIQEGVDISEWWWFDSLHYRKTAKFAETLLEKTKVNPSSDTHAYAIGYLSHLGGDIAGHPYVNLIAGAPYRHQPQRHKFVENYNDVWAYDKYYDGNNLVFSKLYEKMDFGNQQLPDSIAKLLISAIEAVYRPEFGDDITVSDVKDAYSCWIKWFEQSSGGDPLPEPVLFSLTSEFQQIWENFIQDPIVQDILPDLNGGGGLDIDIRQILRSLGLAILAPLLLAGKIIDFISANVTALSTAGFRYMASLMYQHVYNAYHQYHYAVSINGFAFPLNRYLNRTLTRHVNRSSLQDALGGKASFNEFPKKKLSGVDIFPGAHTVYPSTAVELPATLPAPKSYDSTHPDHYIGGNIAFDNTIFEHIKNLQELNLSNFKNHMITDRFGSAMEMTVQMYYSFVQNRSLPNLSLDGDRGMGFPCWKIPQDQSVSEPVSVEFTRDT